MSLKAGVGIVKGWGGLGGVMLKVSRWGCREETIYA